MKTLRLLILTVATMIANSAANAQNNNEYFEKSSDTIEIAYELMHFESAKATVNGIPTEKVENVFINDVIEFEITNNPKHKSNVKMGGIIVYQSNGMVYSIDIPRSNRNIIRVRFVVL